MEYHCIYANNHPTFITNNVYEVVHEIISEIVKSNTASIHINMTLDMYIKSVPEKKHKILCNSFDVNDFYVKSKCFDDVCYNLESITDVEKFIKTCSDNTKNKINDKFYMMSICNILNKKNTTCEHKQTIKPVNILPINNNHIQKCEIEQSVEPNKQVLPTVISSVRDETIKTLQNLTKLSESLNTVQKIEKVKFKDEIENEKHKHKKSWKLGFDKLDEINHSKSDNESDSGDQTESDNESNFDNQTESDNESDFDNESNPDNALWGIKKKKTFELGEKSDESGSDVENCSLNGSDIENLDDYLENDTSKHDNYDEDDSDEESTVSYVSNCSDEELMIIQDELKQMKEIKKQTKSIINSTKKVLDDEKINVSKYSCLVKHDEYLLKREREKLMDEYNKFISEKDFTYGEIFNKFFVKKLIKDFNCVHPFFMLKFPIYLFLDGRDVTGKRVREKILDTKDDFRLFRLIYNSLTDDNFELPEDEEDLKILEEYHNFCPDKNLYSEKEMMDRLNQYDCKHKEIFDEDETSRHSEDPNDDDEVLPLSIMK